MGNRRLIQNFTILLLFSTLFLGSCKKNIDKDTDKQQKIDIKVPNFNADRAYDFIAKQFLLVLEFLVLMLIRSVVIG